MTDEREALDRLRRDEDHDGTPDLFEQDEDREERERGNQTVLVYLGGVGLILLVFLITTCSYLTGGI